MTRKATVNIIGGWLKPLNLFFIWQGKVQLMCWKLAWAFMGYSSSWVLLIGAIRPCRTWVKPDPKQVSTWFKEKNKFLGTGGKYQFSLLFVIWLLIHTHTCRGFIKNKIEKNRGYFFIMNKNYKENKFILNSNSKFSVNKKQEK